jgi:hypothetical protein
MLTSAGIIERQALEDLENDALDLGDVVAEAIHKLGRSPQLHTAVSIFGTILGSSTTATPDPTTTNTNTTTFNKPTLNPSSTQRIPIKHRRLSRMVMENILSLAESAASSVIMFFIALVKGAVGMVSAHWVLVLLLAASVVGNITLSNRAGRAYWSERRADNFLRAIHVAPDGVMSRAITLADLSEAIKPPGDFPATAEGGQGESMCWRKFVERSESGEGSFGSRIFGGRERLGTVRHDLVVALRVVNGIEKDLMGAEWERWREGERRRCKLAARMLGQEGLKGELEGELSKYCEDCEGAGDV